MKRCSNFVNGKCESFNTPPEVGSECFDMHTGRQELKVCRGRDIVDDPNFQGIIVDLELDVILGVKSYTGGIK